MSEQEFGYDSFEDDVDLDPKNRPPSNRIERFKGESKKIYRVALVYFHPYSHTVRAMYEEKSKREGTTVDLNAVKEKVGEILAKRAASLEKTVDTLEEWEKLDLTSAKFKKYESFYHEDVGTVLSRLGKDGPEADKIWKRLGEPRLSYSTIALFYPLDSSGNVDVKNIARDGYVKLWRFSKGTFKTLIDKNEMLQTYNQSLANSDLKLDCKSSQYQTFDIDPAGNALWLRSPALKAKFLPMAYALYDKLIDARPMSTAELKKKLAEAGDDDAGPGPSGSSNGAGRSEVTEDDIEDLLQHV